MKHFMCEYCSRTFSSPAPLKDHISTDHLGTVEHRCNQCGKVLSSETTLRLHQRHMHQDDYKRTCDGCGRQFSRTADLMDHLTKDHPHLLPEKYRSRFDTLVCKQCNMMFSRSNSLLRHNEVIHGGAPKYSCAVCSRRYRCRRYALRHIRTHHPDISVANRSRSVVVDGKSEKNASWWLTTRLSKCNHRWVKYQWFWLVSEKHGLNVTKPKFCSWNGCCLANLYVETIWPAPTVHAAHL